MAKNLILLGMMGTGKSTIGRIIAYKLKMKFIDTDRLIEVKNKMKIKDVFEKKGEAFFRSEEKKITLKCLNLENRVISLGGGAILNKFVRKILFNDDQNKSFWLSLNLEQLAQRIGKSSKRPLLKDSDNLKTLQKIYHQRKNFYNLSDYKIICDKLSKRTIAKKIITIFYDQ